MELGELAAKLAVSADAETKAFLASVLKASEAQAAELTAVRKSLEKSVKPSVRVPRGKRATKSCGPTCVRWRKTLAR